MEQREREKKEQAHSPPDVRLYGSALGCLIRCGRPSRLHSPLWGLIRIKKSARMGNCFYFSLSSESQVLVIAQVQPPSARFTSTRWNPRYVSFIIALICFVGLPELAPRQSPNGEDVLSYLQSPNAIWWTRLDKLLAGRSTCDNGQTEHREMTSSIGLVHL